LTTVLQIITTLGLNLAANDFYSAYLEKMQSIVSVKILLIDSRKNLTATESTPRLRA
jgi:hypothetical protein